MALRIKPLPLHANQEKIFECETRFRVVAAGRRFGKSRVALAECLHRAANLGQRVWWLSPSYGVSNIQWRQTKRVLGGKIFSDKSEQERRLEFFYNGQYGEITFKSGDRPDNLRGEGLDFIVVDEAAFVNPTLWNTVLRPALVDRGGGALFISTPNGRNWFYNLWWRGHIDNPMRDPDWQSFHFTSYDNLAIKNIREEVEAAKRDMPELKFRQEHLAEFLDDVGSYFRGVTEAAKQLTIPYPEYGHLYVAGIDWGRKHDATAITVLDLTDRKQVFGDYLSAVGWERQKAHVLRMYETYQPYKIFAEENAAGQPVIEALNNSGLDDRIVPVFTGPTNKGPMLDSLALNIERGVLTLLSEDDPYGAIQANELKAYSAWQTSSGKWQFGAPYGYMDDTVMALTMANQGITSKPRKLYGVKKNPFYSR